MMKQAKRDLPTTPEEWLQEIRAAYEDAREAIPFGPMAGQPFSEQKLFHLAPQVALKFRGLPVRGETLKRAGDAALSSYVVNQEANSSAMSNPRLAFAFCYLASHYGIGLADVPVIEEVMEYLEQNMERLVKDCEP